LQLLAASALAMGWLKAAGELEPTTTAEKERSLTQLVLGRLVTAYVHFHYICGVVHDDMHTGNILLTAEGGLVKVIDWELAKVVPLPFEARSTVVLRDGLTWETLKPRSGAIAVNTRMLHPQYGVYRKNAMIGDRGTQCDSVFPACSCQYPYETMLDKQYLQGAYIGSFHCNLFGLALEDSWEAVRELSLSIHSRTEVYLGPSADRVKGFWATNASLSELSATPPIAWLPAQEQQQGDNDQGDYDDSDDIDGDYT